MACKLKKLFKKDKKPYTSIGIGFKLSDKKKKKLYEVNLLDENRTGHLFVFATTQVGKTRLVEWMTEQDILKGKNVVIIDPKMDWGLFSKVYQSCLRADREDDFMFLSPIFPQYSVKINPLSHWYMPEEPISHIMAGVPTDDDFFYNVALDATTFIVRAILLKNRATGNNAPLRFKDIAEKASYKGITSLKNEIEAIEDDSEKEALITLGTQILESPQDYFSKVTNTLRTTLTQMTMGSIASIIGNATNNEFIDRIEKGKGVVLYVATGSMLAKKSADILGKVVVSMIQSAAGRFYASNLKFYNPLCLYIDEMSNCVYRGIEDAFNKGGSAGLCITGSTQSMADIVTEIGEDRARKLFDNTNTKIFGRVNDIASSKIIAEYGGVESRFASMFNSDGNITSREVEQDIIKIEQGLRLNKREIFYFGFEGQFEGKIAPVNPSEIMVRPPVIVKGAPEVSK